SVGRGVLYAVNSDLRQLVVHFSKLQVVAPKTSLSFEGELVLGPGGKVAFFAVDVRRHPIPGNQVQTPAVHVEVIGVARRTIVRTVQANDGKILILNPDAPDEASASRVFFGRDVEHQA